MLFSRLLIIAALALLIPAGMAAANVDEQCRQGLDEFMMSMSGNDGCDMVEMERHSEPYTVDPCQQELRCISSIAMYSIDYRLMPALSLARGVIAPPNMPTTFRIPDGSWRPPRLI